MKREALSGAIRDKARKIGDIDSDAGELLRVLARIVEGMEMRKAFGAPGDWGYDTPIGEALRAPDAAQKAAPR